jgi:hypothetical protein
MYHPLSLLDAEWISVKFVFICSNFLGFFPAVEMDDVGFNGKIGALLDYDVFLLV